MNSIQFFITENDKYQAGIYLSRFSKLMRRILDNSKKNWVTMEEELVAIRHYLDLERLRFDDKFDYTIEVDDFDRYLRNRTAVHDYPTFSGKCDLAWPDAG
jgi:sensor histidine kinase YesM